MQIYFIMHDLSAFAERICVIIQPRIVCGTLKTMSLILMYQIHHRMLIKLFGYSSMLQTKAEEINGLEIRIQHTDRM